jgi:hypothetical protein
MDLAALAVNSQPNLRFLTPSFRFTSPPLFTANIAWLGLLTQWVAIRHKKSTPAFKPRYFSQLLTERRIKCDVKTE